MTDFRASLSKLAEAMPGVLAVSIMGTDGIPIDSVVVEEAPDAAGLLVEYSALLDQVRQSAQMLSAGELEELTVRSSELTCIMRLINPEFFLAAVITPRQSMGRTRYLLRVQAPTLLEALA